MAQWNIFFLLSLLFLIKGATAGNILTLLGKIIFHFASSFEDDEPLTSKEDYDRKRTGHRSHISLLEYIFTFFVCLNNM